MTLDELGRGARRGGAATSFPDAGGRFHTVSDTTLRAVLEAMGPAPEATAWPPVVVARQGRRSDWRAPGGRAGPPAPGGGPPPPGGGRGGSRSPWRWRVGLSGRCRPSCPATCRRAGTGWPEGAGPPPWWSRPAVATCRRPWPGAGGPGAGGAHWY